MIITIKIVESLNFGVKIKL